MANKEQLKILKQGVETWNKWRKDNPEIKIDLSDVDLSNANLQHLNLKQAYLKGGHFRQANLRKASLRETNLSDADLREADLIDAMLYKSNLTRSDLNNSNLSWAVLRNADLSKADLRDADLSNTDLRNARLIDSNLRGANLMEANLNNTNFLMSCLIGTTLTGVTMDQTSFVRADLSGADLSWAKMKDINTSRWIIKDIKCTHIFKDGKRIDYAEGEFEKAYTQIENLVEMIINAPFSDLTHYIGQIIEQETNRKHGEASLIFKGHTALSNDTTKYEFISFSENKKLYEIKKQLADIQNGLKPVIEEALAKQETKDIVTVSEKIPLAPLPLDINTSAINNVFIDRFNKMNPLLQKIILTIQSVF